MSAPFTVSAAFGRAVREFARGLPSITALSAVAVLAPEALDRAVHSRGPLSDGPADYLPVAAFLGAWALQHTTAASAVLARAAGERTSPLRLLGRAARRVVPAAVAGVLAAAAVAAGLVVLVVPGLVALASLAVAPPAAIEERSGPARALVRSLDLTRGHRWQVLALLALLCAAAFGGMAASWGVLGYLEDGGAEVPAIAAVFVLVLFTALPAAGMAVAYAALREAKEAPHRPAELVRVFE